MGWTDKLPSLKGLTAFFYVATHWSAISQDLDAYRSQIEDRNKWIQDLRATLEAKEGRFRIEREELIQRQEELSGFVRGLAVELESRAATRDDLIERSRLAATQLERAIVLVKDLQTNYAALLVFTVLFFLSRRPDERGVWLGAFPEPVRRILTVLNENFGQKFGPSAVLPSNMLQPDAFQEMANGVLGDFQKKVPDSMP